MTPTDQPQPDSPDPSGTAEQAHSQPQPDTGTTPQHQAENETVNPPTDNATTQDENTATQATDQTPAAAESSAATPGTTSDSSPAAAAAVSDAGTTADDAATADTETAAEPTDANADATNAETQPASDAPAEDTAAVDASEPKGPAPTPSEAASHAHAPTPTVPPLPETTDLAPEAIAKQAERGRQWGRVDDKQEVFVRDGDTERAIGSYPGASDDEALAYFVRKYDELEGQVKLVEQRLAVVEPPIKEIARSIKTLTPALIEPHVLGDLPSLRQRLAAAETSLASRKAEAELLRLEAKKQAQAEREDIVKTAEEIAGQAPERTSWKNSGDAMKKLFDTWKTHQRSHVRLDKAVEEDLWQRFRKARSAFDRNRRAHFAELDKKHGAAKEAKEKLIERAEKLSTSKDWGATSAAYRDLMNEWKKSPRAGRKDDDALWERFRAAQDKFFTARTEANSAQDKEFEANLVVKEELLKEAEALLPVTDAKKASKALRVITNKWDAAGKVPRRAMKDIENRLRVVEQAVRQAEDDKWKSNRRKAPVRADGMLGQLEESIARLESDLEKAKARGNDSAAKRAEEALETQRAWLKQVQGGSR